MRTVRFFISNQIVHSSIFPLHSIGLSVHHICLQSLFGSAGQKDFITFRRISFFVQLSTAEENSRWSLVDLIAWFEGHILFEALDTHHLNCSCPCIMTIEDLCQAG